MADLFPIIDKLAQTHTLSGDEYKTLIENRTPEAAAELAKKALAAKQAVYGNAVFIRGLIEISSYCKNDCLYCGLRRSNRGAERYRLTREEILECCAEGYKLGFRTFVLQGGEDPVHTDTWLCDTVQAIKQAHPDCAVTLSVGERSTESYRKLREAGADRYLLRHETADACHYATLHPTELTLENRIRCIRDLKALGFQTGVGFMVGSPGQTTETLVKDLQFVEEIQPAMCGIGPFLPHHATPFATEPAGSAELTCYLVSILRLIRPNLLLPSTTALGTLIPDGRERGILAGANVVMPNLSPSNVRKKYAIYDNKVSDGAEAAQGLATLKARIASTGSEIVIARGDIKL